MLEGDAAADYVGIWMRGEPLNAAKLRRDALRASRSAAARGRLLFARTVRRRLSYPSRSWGVYSFRRRPRRAGRTRRTRALAPSRPASDLAVARTRFPGKTREEGW